MDKDTALKLALEALGAYMEATDSDEDAKAHSLMAQAFFAIKEALAQPKEKYIYGTPLLDAMTNKEKNT